MPVTRAVLFDLDGTLLVPPICLPQADCITQAITEVYGFDAGHGPDCVPPEVQIDWTGQTDFTVVEGIVGRAGVRADLMALARWQERYEALCANRLPLNMRGQLRPGISFALGSLIDAGYTLRVVTGNTERVAKMKLTAAGILEFFDTAASGYATPEHRERVDIVRHAMQGVAWGTLVGDTWRDMKAGQKAGICAIGFASQRQLASTLMRHGAIRVVDGPPDMVACIADLYNAREAVA